MRKVVLTLERTTIVTNGPVNS